MFRIYSLNDSIKKIISDSFGDSLYITESPITKSGYTCSFANDYISTDTVVKLVDYRGDDFESMNDYEIVGKTLVFGNDKVSRKIISYSDGEFTIEDELGIDVYANDTVTIEIGSYIFMTSIGSGEDRTKTDDYLNLYNRYLFEIGASKKGDIENIKIELLYLFKDVSYPFIDELNVETNSRFYLDDNLSFNTYLNTEGTYIEKGFIKFTYNIVR